MLCPRHLTRNMCVFGDAGCGKTYFLKQLIAFILKNTNDEIYIISSCADEYDAILKDGNRFDFDGSCGYFNPLDYYCSIDASYRYEVKVKDDYLLHYVHISWEEKAYPA